MEQAFASMSSYHNSSPAMSTTPYESMVGTPEIIPSDDRIMAHISHTRIDGIAPPERPQVFVDTSLLFCSQPNYPPSGTGAVTSAQELSPGLLSPYSGSNEAGFPLQSQLTQRRGHGHTRSAEDGQCFGFGDEFANGANGRGRGLQRVRSAPTSREHSRHKRSKQLPRTVNNSRSISPGQASGSGSGTYYPADDGAQPSPSPSPSESVGRHMVATERILAASSARRLNPPM
jgi:hypothetical protein